MPANTGTRTKSYKTRETVGYLFDVEDKNKLVKQNLFPFFWGILNHFKKKNRPSKTRFLVDSSELRDYHLTAKLIWVKRVAELVNN